MTDAAVPAKRPDNCQAVPFGPYQTCERCGLAWDPSKTAPACGAMSFGRIRDRLFADISRAVDEADHLIRIAEAGTPAAPLPVLARMMELRATMRLVDRITDSEPILDILNPKRRGKA